MPFHPESILLKGGAVKASYTFLIELFLLVVGFDLTSRQRDDAISTHLGLVNEAHMACFN